MKQSIMVVLFCVAIMVSWFVYNQPRTYEDCILQALGENESDASASIKAVACRKKFPAPPNPFDQFDSVSKN